jgi:hypothetical protein
MLTRLSLLPAALCDVKPVLHSHRSVTEERRRFFAGPLTGPLKAPVGFFGFSPVREFGSLENESVLARFQSAFRLAAKTHGRRLVCLYTDVTCIGDEHCGQLFLRAGRLRGISILLRLGFGYGRASRKFVHVVCPRYTIPPARQKG